MLQAAHALEVAHQLGTHRWLGQKVRLYDLNQHIRLGNVALFPRVRVVGLIASVIADPHRCLTALGDDLKALRDDLTAPERRCSGHRYPRPVWPKPPAPRSVSSSTATSVS